MATAAEVDLDELIARLSHRDAVDGVVLVGSTGTNTMRASSDHDVLIVINEPALPLLVGLTTVGGRLTDLLFATAQEVEQLASGAGPPGHPWPGRLARWLTQGRIVFDRTGRLQRLRERLAETPLPVDPDGGIPQAWFSLNYDLAQNRRLAASADHLDRLALQIRLLYGIFGLLQGYFRLRGLDWTGEKAAIRYLESHDPDYLAALRAALDEADPAERMTRYEALAERTLYPVGGVWKPGAANFQFRPGTEVSPGLLRESAQFWESLVQASDSG